MLGSGSESLATLAHTRWPRKLPVNVTDRATRLSTNSHYQSFIMPDEQVEGIQGVGGLKSGCGTQEDNTKPVKPGSDNVGGNVMTM